MGDNEKIKKNEKSYRFSQIRQDGISRGRSDVFRKAESLLRKIEREGRNDSGREALNALLKELRDDKDLIDEISRGTEQKLKEAGLSKKVSERTRDVLRRYEKMVGKFERRIAKIEGLAGEEPERRWTRVKDFFRKLFGIDIKSRAGSLIEWMRKNQKESSSGVLSEEVTYFNSDLREMAPATRPVITPVYEGGGTEAGSLG